MALDDVAYGRQADARALVLVATVQPHERLEQVLRVLHVEADTVVADKEGLAAVDRFPTERDLGPLAAARVLPSVGEQVLQRYT